MKKQRTNTILLLLVILVGWGCSANSVQQEFEGEITYATTLVSKMPNMSDSALQAAYGSSLVRILKQGNVKYNYTGQYIKEGFVIQADNKAYDLYHGIDSIFVTDLSTEFKTLLDTTFTANDTIILGRTCHKIVHRSTDNGITYTTTYWYDPSIYLPAKHFTAMKFGFTDLYYNRAQSPYLLYKYDGENFTGTHTATKIEEIQVNDSVFALPTGVSFRTVTY